MRHVVQAGKLKRPFRDCMSKVWKNELNRLSKLKSFGQMSSLFHKAWMMTKGGYSRSDQEKNRKRFASCNAEGRKKGGDR